MVLPIGMASSNHTQPHPPGEAHDHYSGNSIGTIWEKGHIYASNALQPCKVWGFTSSPKDEHEACCGIGWLVVGLDDGWIDGWRIYFHCNYVARPVQIILLYSQQCQGFLLCFPLLPLFFRRHFTPAPVKRFWSMDVNGPLQHKCCKTKRPQPKWWKAFQHMQHIPGE